jgi:N-dimethylarginine dimethylaminohydrolase
MNIHATLGCDAKPRYLMCPPQYFAVTYSINPWMDPQAWNRAGTPLRETAERQWDGLRRALISAGAAIEILPPEPGLPDLVFTANAAVVLDGKVLLARFRHGERQGEEPVNGKVFRELAANGVIAEVATMPAGVTLEGAGDCIWDRRRRLFWVGCGFRSDAAAAGTLTEVFGVRCRTLQLADPKFYHLDTAFCALPCGGVIYYPPAFTTEALTLIHGDVAPADRIALDRADAERFAANAVCAGRTIILSRCSVALRQKLERRGYAVVETPLDVFQKSGGSACCLTLRLDHQSAPAAIFQHNRG